MAYVVDQETGDIVISGFEKGIGDSPYSGLTDMRNINISSVPGEAVVNFKTTSKTQPVISDGVMTSAFTTGNTGINFTGATQLENGMCIYFTGLSSQNYGLLNNTPYWIYNLGVNGAGTTSLSNAYECDGGTLATITNAFLTGNFLTYNINTPKYIIQQGNTISYSSPTAGAPYYWMVDSQGWVWTNKPQGGAPPTHWRFAGNALPNPTGSNARGSNGNGLVYYQSATTGTPTGYIFAFRDGTIDYTKVDATCQSPIAISWVYSWNPNTGYNYSSGTNATTLAGYINNSGTIPCLHSIIGSSNSHESWVMPDGRVYFCDGYNIGKFFQTNVLNGADFDPTNTATYTYTTYPLLPTNDLAQCMAPSGTNILIGGGINQIYSWDTTSSVVSFPYLIAESNIVKMITINANTYIFSGNRGRIYITNGSQVQLFKKIPDHLSGTIEPYFAWGGVCSLKNQLYFGLAITDNAGTRNSLMGGVWAIDVNTQALRVANQLSYGSYAGNATALFGQGNPSSTILGQPYPTYNPLGSGLVIGWNNTYYGSANGVDISSGSLYTSGESYLVSDMIPVGTLLKPITPLQLEFKLSAPLLTGESIELQIAPSLSVGTNPTFTSVFTTNGDGSLISGNSSAGQGFPLKEFQWLLVKAILTGGTGSPPSYNRLTELRIIGATLTRSAMSMFGVS